MMQKIDNKKIHTLVVQNNKLNNGFDTTKKEQIKNKGVGAFCKRTTFLSFPNGNLLFCNPRPFINSKIESMQNNQKKGNGTNNSNAVSTSKNLQHQNLQLQEQLAYTACLGDVFMHYVCTVSIDIVLTPEKLGQVHLTYLQAVNQVM